MKLARRLAALLELLDDAAEEYGQSRCELIDEAVRAWLAK